MALNELQQRVIARLAELKIGAVEAAGTVEGLEKNFIRDLIEGRKRSFSQAKAPAVAKALQWTIAELRGENADAAPRVAGRGKLRVIQVPLLDRVTAGTLVSPMSQIPQEQGGHIALSGLTGGEYFALRVEGSSMNRVSPEGSVIIVNKNDRHLVNGRFYVFAVRGETTYKRWHAEPEYLEPYSTEQDLHAPIFIRRRRDLEVIGRVRRTVLDL